MKTDAIVIGAGIVGAACAYELARQGLNVQVLDARIGGATAAGMGHLVIMDDLEAELKLSHWSVQLWHELAGFRKNVPIAKRQLYGWRVVLKKCRLQRKNINVSLRKVFAANFEMQRKSVNLNLT